MNKHHTHTNKIGIHRVKTSGKKYADLIREFVIEINQIELEDSKTIQTTFT